MCLGVENDVSLFNNINLNIFDNAFYWLGQKTQTYGRKISINSDTKNSTLLVTNNGPSLASNVKSNLFLFPFVTSKPNGRGLGMYICSEILSLYGGKIKIVTNEEDSRVMSIGFVIHFPPRD